MFHVINSLNLEEYVAFLLIAIVICIAGLFTLKKSQKTWRWGLYVCIILFCMFIAERIISEYMPGSDLAQIFEALALASFPVFFVLIFIIGFYANRK